jgi:hypothetical protein
MVFLSPTSSAPDTTDFKRFCDVTILPGLAAFERRRHRVILWAAAAIGCAGASWLIYARFMAGSLVYLLPVLLVGIPLGIGLSHVSWNRLRSDFKRHVLTHVVKFVAPDLAFDPDAMVHRDVFVGSGLFKLEPDRYDGEDHVAGKLGETHFQFSEIHAERRMASTNNKGEKWETLFQGIFFVADFNKHFHSTTVVLPDTLEPSLGFLARTLQKINVNRDQLIQLEDREFEREFVVYGENQVEARYILTPALMQRMLSLKRKFGAKVFFSFTGASVHVAIATTHNHFEPRLFSAVTDLTHIESFLNDLRAITGIIEDLNLNTRIWTKV